MGSHRASYTQLAGTHGHYRNLHKLPGCETFASDSNFAYRIGLEILSCYKNPVQFRDDVVFQKFFRRAGVVSIFRLRAYNTFGLTD